MKKFAALLVCAVLCPAVWGSEFRAGEVTRLEDIPQDQQQTDDNGDVLSLLSIKTDIPSLHFEPSWLGIYNIEKTEGGYDLLLPYGSAWLRLSAPGFKSYQWDFGVKDGLNPGVHYYGTIEQEGTAPQPDSLADVNITGTFESRMWDLEVRMVRGDSRPMLKINTDLPFAFLKQYVLREGAYEAQETNMAPYKLRFPAGTSLQEVVRTDTIGGDIAWDTKMESSNVYMLDLSWTDKKYVRDLAQNIKQRMKR